jgi:hypothetical protein
VLALGESRHVVAETFVFARIALWSEQLCVSINIKAA